MNFDYRLEPSRGAEAPRLGYPDVMVVAASRRKSSNRLLAPFKSTLWGVYILYFLEAAAQMQSAKFTPCGSYEVTSPGIKE